MSYVRAACPAINSSSMEFHTMDYKDMLFCHPNYEGELHYSMEKADVSSTFFPFSPPILNDVGFHDLYFSIPENDPPPLPPVPETTPPASSRRRTTRKDRHSKICTAQGPRDRRMRLSLDVARKFFDLQDLLGFDKASKTIQWLLKMSKAAIKELVAATKSDASSASESEEDDAAVLDKSPALRSQTTLASGENSNKTRRATAMRPLRSRASVQPKVARESRNKARERARERTLEKKKMMMIQHGCALQGDGNQENQRLSTDVKPVLLCGGIPQESISLNPKMDDLPHYSTSSTYNGSADSDALFDYSLNVLSLHQEPWKMNYVVNIDDGVIHGGFPS
ncbi:hypothetical protein HPP92_009159 [Vanilla planifolia]|uniref:Uncharacterized protein n=1 Tax=Vanilla planifolia TaxID=51239 RepID=A0A835RDR7_VANPL|nr:hypothetical protein HPP92_009159 [Vanilla planifolia]